VSPHVLTTTTTHPENNENWDIRIIYPIPLIGRREGEEEGEGYKLYLSILFPSILTFQLLPNLDIIITIQYSFYFCNCNCNCSGKLLLVIVIVSYNYDRVCIL